MEPVEYTHVIRGSAGETTLVHPALGRPGIVMPSDIPRRTMAALINAAAVIKRTEPVSLNNPIKSEAVFD